MPSGQPLRPSLWLCALVKQAGFAELISSGKKKKQNHHPVAESEVVAGCRGRGAVLCRQEVFCHCCCLSCSIEKKRAVVPTLAEAVTTRGGREVNWEYFYQLLFTVENLKLVHIACHKKTNHNLSCDKSRIYRTQQAEPRCPRAAAGRLPSHRVLSKQPQLATPD